MSNSDNPFSAPTTVAEPVVKSPAPKRGLAHIVRRGKKPSQGSPAPSAKGSKKSDTAKGGKAHVISRNAPTHLAEDSIDQLITSPALKTPQKPEEPIPEARGKKNAVAINPQSTVRGGGPLGTGSIDELTVEDGRPLPPQAMVDLADNVAPEIAPPEDPNRGFLAVRSGADLGRRVGLLEGRTTIGRGLDCDIVLTDPTISRQHAYVERRENVYVVCDLGSGNGTFVNERERQDEVLIVNGDTFRIGSSVICFEGPEAQDEAASTANWAAQAVGGKKKGRRRQITNDEESTVAGKALVVQSPPTHLDEPDPVTQAPTGIVESVQVAAPPTKPKRSKRKKTVPPPIPEDKKSVQDAALAALSSIVNTPTPELIAVNQTGLGELPNQTVPPTPSPAILYPINAPNSNPYPSAPPPMNLGQPAAPPRAASMPMSQPPPPAYGMNPGAPMQMRQGPQGPQGPPPMGPGMPPPPMGGYQQPSGPQMHRPMLAGAAPDMMRQGYGPGNPPPRENGKLLIGFISVTLVLVVVGLLATVIGQMEDGKKDGDKKAAAALGADAGAMAAEPAISPDEKDDPIEDVKDDPTKDVKDDPTKDVKGDPTKDVKGDPTKDVKDVKDDPTKDVKGDPIKDVKGDPTKDEKDDPTPPGKEVIMLADLTAGKTTLGISTWGTDETFLSSMTDITPTVEPIEAVKDDPDATTDPEGSDPDDPKKDDPKKDDPKKDDPKKDDPKKDDPKKDKPRNTKTKVRTPKNTTPKVRTPKNVPDDDPPNSGSAAARAATEQAKTLYKNMKFVLASKLLVKAADNLPDGGADADKLYDLSDGYKDVGELFALAEKKKDQNNYAGALSDYKNALTKDKRSAGGALSSLLRLRIGQVAAKAAGTYMSSGEYQKAKQAVYDAKRNGNDSDIVDRLLASLESKANRFIKQALKAKKNGDTSEAKDLLKKALEAAPKKSDAEDQARSEIKRL